MNQHCDVLGINYIVSNPEDAVEYVKEHIEELRGQYITFSNVHTTVMARESEAYCKVQNGAAIAFADGAPVAKYQRKKGFSEAQRVCGPDFMKNMFLKTKDGGLTHYFYGSSEETIELLREKLSKEYPGMKVVGLVSPPFRALTEEEDRKMIEEINASGADLIWIGLGAPKQEQWMAAHQGAFHGVMLGVGAGFNFHAGNIKRAPEWVQKLSLEWLYRLLQDPKRLFKRYLVTNTKWYWYTLREK